MAATLPVPPDPAIRHESHDELNALLGQLQILIAHARQRALRAVDVIQVQTCWQVGRHLVTFEQGGAARAAYGKRLLPLLAERLTQEFGKGFDERNLRHMRAFFQAFPIWDAVRSEVRYSVLNGSEQLFASRYKLVLPSEDELRRELTRDAEAIRLAMNMNKAEADDGNKD